MHTKGAKMNRPIYSRIIQEQVFLSFGFNNDMNRIVLSLLDEKTYTIIDGVLHSNRSGTYIPSDTATKRYNNGFCVLAVCYENGIVYSDVNQKECGDYKKIGQIIHGGELVICTEENVLIQFLEARYQFWKLNKGASA